jgi:hypothetical protein
MSRKDERVGKMRGTIVDGGVSILLFHKWTSVHDGMRVGRSGPLRMPAGRRDETNSTERTQFSIITIHI